MGVDVSEDFFGLAGDKDLEELLKITTEYRVELFVSVKEAEQLLE